MENGESQREKMVACNSPVWPTIHLNPLLPLTIPFVRQSRHIRLFVCLLACSLARSSLFSPPHAFSLQRAELGAAVSPWLLPFHPHPPEYKSIREDRKSITPGEERREMRRGEERRQGRERYGYHPSSPCKDRPGNLNRQHSFY